MEAEEQTATGWDRRLHTLKESFRPSAVRSRARSWNWHRLIVSFWGCISFVGLGTSLIVFGPTLLDIASHLSVGVGVLAVMFTCRAVGSGIGSVSTGLIFDKYASWSYTTLSVITTSCIASTVLVPLSSHAAVLGIFMFFNGIATGALENGVHAVLMRLWGSKSGPCMQILHFSWAFGAFIAPLIAKRFIREIPDNENNDMMYNLTCSDIWTNTSTMMDESTSDTPITPGIDYDCFLGFIEACKYLTNSSHYYIDSLEEPNLGDFNCTTTTSASSGAPTDFRFAYFIAASLFLPSLVAFIFYAVRRECFGKCYSKLAIARRQSELKQIQKVDDSSSEDEFGKPPLCFTILLFSQLFCFMFLYVGLEAGFGSLIFTVAVTGQLGFSKPTAAILQSVYWGTFCFTRMISVTCALFGVRASIMIAGNLFGSFVASLIMTFYIHNALAIWIGSAVLGMSYASIFPTAMTWMSENAKATGKATAVLVTAGTVGDITLPAVMGAMVAKVSPDSLIYFTIIGVIISAATAAVMFLTACLQKRRLRLVARRDLIQTQTVKYERLNVDSNPDLEDEVEINDLGDLNEINETCIINGSAAVQEDGNSIMQ